MDCKHENFVANVSVYRLTEEELDQEIKGHRCEVKVQCAECGEKMQFLGVPGGYNNSHPTVNFDCTTLRAPLRPESKHREIKTGVIYN